MKNHHISEAGVSFKIWAGEHNFYIWQQTIALNTCLVLRRLFLYFVRDGEIARVGVGYPVSGTCSRSSFCKWRAAACLF